MKQVNCHYPGGLARRVEFEKVKYHSWSIFDAHIDILQPEVSDSSEDFKIHGPDPTDGEIALNVTKTEERFSLVKSETMIPRGKIITEN